MPANLRVYIATRYADRQIMNTVVRRELEAIGCDVVSSWHASEHKNDAMLTDLAVVKAYDQNRKEMDEADVVLLFAAPGARETYAEGEAAFTQEIPVVWAGPLTLSARRWSLLALPHCFPVDDLEGALEVLKHMRGNGL